MIETAEPFITTEYVTKPEATTYTINCEVKNVTIKDETMIKAIIADPTILGERIIGARCNFGEYPLGSPIWHPVKPPKSNRGRKPKVKPVKNVKKQGSGECLNSQITLAVKIDPSAGPNKDDIICVKVFNNGLCQLAGQKPDYYSSSLEVVRYLVNWLSVVAKSPNAQLDSFVANMKNAKMRIRLGTGQTIRKDILLAELLAQPPEFGLSYATIASNDSKIMAQFMFNEAGGRRKTVSVKFLASGKINVQGADSTLQIQTIANRISDLVGKKSEQILIFQSLSNIEPNMPDNIPLWDLTW